MSTSSDDAVSFSSVQQLMMNGDATTTRNHTTNRGKAHDFWSSWKNALVVIGIGVMALIIGITIAKNHSNMSVLESRFQDLKADLATYENKTEKSLKQIKGDLKDDIDFLKHFTISSVKNDDNKPIAINITQLATMEIQIARLEKWHRALESKVSSITNGPLVDEVRFNDLTKKTKSFEAEINSVRSDLTHLQAWKSTVDTKLMNLTPSSSPSGSDVSENEISNIKNEIISIQNDVSELQQKSGHSGSSNSSKGNVPMTCEDIFNDGKTLSGDYLIDPDGPGPLNSFTVYCDVNKRSTIIKHNKMIKRNITNCKPTDCYHLAITYENSKEHIIALIDSSESCRQSIEFDCFSAKLTDTGTWTDRHGEDQTYFTGAKYGEKICQCGIPKFNDSMENNCFHVGNTVNYCQCDNKDAVNRQDVGFITNMTALPIAGFKYGHMYLDSHLQRASIKIGPLECKGKIDTSENGGSCKSLKMQGRPTGYYLLDTNNGTEQMVPTTRPVLHVSKCNMSLGTSDPKFQVDMGYIPLFIGDVNVVVDITEDHYVQQRTPIPFDLEIFDPTNSFFPDNSTFVVPWTGYFTFSKENFRCENSDLRDMYGHLNGRSSSSFTFEIPSGAGVNKKFNQGDFVVIYRDDSSITLGCTKSDPCRLTIKGEP